MTAVHISYFSFLVSRFVLLVGVGVDRRWIYSDGIHKITYGFISRKRSA